MRLMKRPWMWPVAALLAAGCLLTTSRFAAAQAVPTADQIQIFQSLTPEQQDAILKQLGGGAR